MTGMQIALMGVGTGLFALWTALMFRALFRLRRRAAGPAGTAFPGLGTTLRLWGTWLRSAEDAPERRQLGIVTAALILWIAANALGS